MTSKRKILPSKEALLLSLASILITLALIEGFFSLNRRFQWLSPIDTSQQNGQRDETQPLDLNKLPGLSAEILKTAKPSEKFDSYIDGLPDYAHAYPPGQFLWGSGDTDYIPNNQIDVEVHTLLSHRLFIKTHYSIDAFSRRITPNNPAHADLDLPMIGCSFIFGDDVHDDETIPSFLQRLRPKDRILNLGRQGASASFFFDRFSRLDYLALKGIKPGSHYLYVFMHDHPRRSAGAWSWFRSTPPNEAYPHFDLLPDGKLKAVGQIKNQYGLWMPLVRLFNDSSTFNFFNFDFPKASGEDSKLEAALINGIQNEIHKRDPRALFTVVIFPDESPEMGDAMAAALSAYHIDVIDLSKISLHKTLHGAELGSDGGHPSALANRIVAALIQQKLSERVKPK